MKYLLVLLLLFALTSVEAAPARKRIVWEYATVDFNARRGDNYGVELHLPRRKSIFMDVDNGQTPAYKTYMLNQLGSQGWELVATAGGHGSDLNYIFKRQK